MRLKDTCIRVKDYVATWEAKCYSDGIPDEVPEEIESLAPSYKHIAMCILNNDLHLSAIGYSRPRSEVYGTIKAMELGVCDPQMRLF